MMQMARAEVHRMDLAAASHSRKRRQVANGDAEVLQQEIKDLKKKLQTSADEKADLVQTLRRMLSKNSTKIFQRQAEHAQQMKMALEIQCGNDRRALEAKVSETSARNEEIK